MDRRLRASDRRGEALVPVGEDVLRLVVLPAAELLASELEVEDRVVDILAQGQQVVGLESMSSNAPESVACRSRHDSMSSAISVRGGSGNRPRTKSRALK